MSGQFTTNIYTSVGQYYWGFKFPFYWPRIRFNDHRISRQLDAHGLVQYVTERHIRVHGRPLDVVITREMYSIIQGTLSIIDPGLYSTKDKYLVIDVTQDCAKSNSIPKRTSSHLPLSWIRAVLYVTLWKHIILVSVFWVKNIHRCREKNITLRLIVPCYIEKIQK